MGNTLENVINTYFNNQGANVSKAEGNNTNSNNQGANVPEAEGGQQSGQAGAVEEETSNTTTTSSTITPSKTRYEKYRAHGLEWFIYNPAAKYLVFSVEPYIIAGLAFILSIVLIVQAWKDGDIDGNWNLVSAVWWAALIYVLGWSVAGGRPEGF